MSEQAITQEDISLLEKFRQEAVRFRDAFNALVTYRGDVRNRPELQAEYDNLYATGNTIKKTVETITKTVDGITGFFRDTFGLNGMAGRSSAQLGALPLIPIALISGALAAMGKWVRDVYLFERKVSEQKRLESEGYSPDQAAAVVRETVHDNTLFGSLAALAKPLGFVAALYFAGQFLRGRG